MTKSEVIKDEKVFDDVKEILELVERGEFSFFKRELTVEGF